MLVVALMRSRLDCGNAVLVGLSTASSSDAVECGGRADLFPGIRRPCRADAVVSLHWSRVPERIAHKVAALTYKVIRDIAPRHLGPLVRVADLGRLNMEKWRTKFDYYVLLYYVNVRKNATVIMFVCDDLQTFKVKSQRSRSQQENVVGSRNYCSLLGNRSCWI